MKALIVGNDYYTERFAFLLKGFGVSCQKTSRLLPKDLARKDMVFLSGKSCTSRNIWTSLRNNCSVFSEQLLFEKKTEISLVDYARRNSLKLLVGGFDVFNPVVSEVKKLIEKERTLEIFFNRVGPKQFGYVKLNIIDDLVFQDIGIISHLLGEETKIINAQSDDLFNHCLAHLKSGETNILLYANKNVYYKERKMEFFCERLRILADILNQRLLLLKAEGINQSLYGTGHESFKEFLVRRREPLRLAVENFLEGRKNPIGYDIIRRNLEIAHEMKRILSRKGFLRRE